MTSHARDQQLRELLGAHGIADVHLVETASDGTVEVTFTDAPTDHVVTRVRQLLAPAGVRTIWYEGAYETLEPDEIGHGTADEADEADEAELARRPCAVCEATPATWQHFPRTPPESAVASAPVWPLCDRCHELAEAGESAALADRMTTDLDHDLLLGLARRLH